MDGCFLVNSRELQFVSIINEHNEARQSGFAHESTGLLPSCKGNDLQAGKGRSLQDDEEEETLKRNGRRLSIYGVAGAKAETCGHYSECLRVA